MEYVYIPALTSPLPRPPTHLLLCSGRPLVATVEGQHQSKTSPSRIPPGSREDGREVELWPSLSSRYHSLHRQKGSIHVHLPNYMCSTCITGPISSLPCSCSGGGMSPEISQLPVLGGDMVERRVCTVYMYIFASRVWSGHGKAVRCCVDSADVAFRDGACRDHSIWGEPIRRIAKHLGV